MEDTPLRRRIRAELRVAQNHQGPMLAQATRALQEARMHFDNCDPERGEAWEQIAWQQLVVHNNSSE